MEGNNSFLVETDHCVNVGKECLWYFDSFVGLADYFSQWQSRCPPRKYIRPVKISTLHNPRVLNRRPNFGDVFWPPLVIHVL